MNVPVFHDYIAEIEDVIEAARNGKMFILIDAEDRENEGDLVIPAQMCTPDSVNFMAKYGRGLICLALTQERAQALKIPMMTEVNGTVRQLAVGAGKDGNMYIVDRNNMGKFTSVGNNIWQQLSGVLSGGVWATPAYFNFGIYYGPQDGPLMAFSVTNALLSNSPTSQSSTRFTNPGTFPVVSANGTANAIVWAYENASPAVLHAYAAANLATELYNSKQAPNGRDQFGAGNKNIVPVVADGKVFVATTNSVAVFGLLP